jgi:hypothetical protein
VAEKRAKEKMLQKERPVEDDLAVTELLKKIEASRSQRPKGQMYLKHLNPLNNIRAAQGLEIVILLISQYFYRNVTIRFYGPSQNCAT